MTGTGTAEQARGGDLVAVVVAVHDVEPFMAETLDSLLAQTWPDWTCVVVDDGSTDGTVDVVRRYLDDPRFRLVQQAQAGSGAARNAGLALVGPQVPFVAFLDGDDTWLPHALESLVARLRAAPDAVGAYGMAEYLDERSRPIRLGEHPWRQRDRRRMQGRSIITPPQHEDTTFSTLLVSGPIWPSCVVVHRREVLAQVGGFDERLRLQQDWDLYVRESRRGPFVVLDEQVAWYRQHGTNVTHRTVQRVYFQDAVRRKTWAARENSPQQRREATRAWRALHLRRVLAALRRVAAAARSGDLRLLARAVRGTAVLLGQALAPGPPVPDARTVELTGRVI